MSEPIPRVPPLNPCTIIVFLQTSFARIIDATNDYTTLQLMFLIYCLLKTSVKNVGRDMFEHVCSFSTKKKGFVKGYVASKIFFQSNFSFFLLFFFFHFYENWK